MLVKKQNYPTKNDDRVLFYQTKYRKIGKMLHQVLNVKCKQEEKKCGEKNTQHRNSQKINYCCGGAACIGGANLDMNATLLCNTFLMIAGTLGLLAAASVASRSS